MKRLFPFLVSTMLMLSACTQDAYDKGEGSLSKVEADFVEAYTDANKQVFRVVTDEGESLTFSTPFTQKWAQTADSVYRALLYYRRMAQSDTEVEALSCGQVSVPGIVPRDSVKVQMKTDPVRMESVWLSKNRRYLNMGFYLKSGATDDEKAVHRLGIVADSLQHHPGGKATLWLRLYHDQGGVPQYYSQRSYVSISVANIKADSIALAVNTYEGEKVTRQSLR